MLSTGAKIFVTREGLLEATERFHPSLKASNYEASYSFNLNFFNSLTIVSLGVIRLEERLQRQHYCYQRGNLLCLRASGTFPDRRPVMANDQGLLVIIKAL